MMPSNKIIHISLIPKPYRKKICTALLLLIFVMLFPFNAHSQALIDLNADVSFTITYKHEGAPVRNIPFGLYYAAESDQYGELKLTGDFSNYPVRVNGLDSSEWRALAQTLEGFALRDKLKPLDKGSTDKNGSLIFPNQQQKLSPGLYLVLSRPSSSAGYTYTTEPFLIFLPNPDSKSDKWSYEASVSPKYSRKDNPSGGGSSDDSVSKKVLKVWKNDASKTRPENITVHLLKNGAVYDSVVLNGENNWRYGWDKLPEYDSDGSAIVWNITEEVPDGYTMLVSKNGITFMLTNTYSSEGPPNELPSGPPSETSPETPEETNGPQSDTKLPQTGQLWWPVPVLVASGLMFMIIGIVLGKKKDHE